MLSKIIKYVVGNATPWYLLSSHIITIRPEQQTVVLLFGVEMNPIGAPVFELHLSGVINTTWTDDLLIASQRGVRGLR